MSRAPKSQVQIMHRTASEPVPSERQHTVRAVNPGPRGVRRRRPSLRRMVALGSLILDHLLATFGAEDPSAEEQILAIWEALEVVSVPGVRKKRWYIELRYIGERAKQEGKGIKGYVGNRAEIVLDRGRALAWTAEEEAQEIAEKALRKLQARASNPDSSWVTVSGDEMAEILELRHGPARGGYYDTAFEYRYKPLGSGAIKDAQYRPTPSSKWQNADRGTILELAAHNRGLKTSNPMSSKRIRVDRKGYCVEPTSYYRDGKLVERSGYCVEPTSFTIEDPGRPGRRTRGAKAGPYSRNKIDPETGKPYQPWIKREGKLGGPGYTKKSQKDRRAILEACVGEYGYRSCLGSLQVVLRSSELEAKTRKRLTADKDWLVKKFGGPGSFGPRSGNPMNEEKKYLGTIGDSDPITHWGGFVSDSGYGPHLTYFQSYEDRVSIYGVFIEDDVYAELDWVDWDAVSQYADVSKADLRKYGSSEDPLARAQVYETVAGYYGWGEFDFYPQDITLEEAEEIYGPEVDAAHPAQHHHRTSNPNPKGRVRKIKNRVLR